MAKQKEAPRGATLRVVQERKQRTFKLPALPVIHWQWILLPVFAAALLTGMHWGYKSWPIRSIEVSGRMTVLSTDSLIAAVSWVKGESFFSLDVQRVYQDLIALPLVQNVVVRKRWPGVVQLVVTEDLPMAVWNDKQLLTISGRISDVPAGVDISALARMEGQDDQAEMAMRSFRRVQQSLDEMALHINELSVDAVGSVTVKLSNGWEVNFGRQYFDERLLRLSRLLARLPQEKVAGLDLRYGKGAAVRWRSEQEMG